MSERSLISIVVPVFREAGNLKALHQQTVAALATTELDWELVFVNDGSPDRSLEVMLELAQSDARVRVVDLARNYGKELALTAGLDAARGEATVFMDADLQHPPAIIPRLIEEWMNGAEVVVGVRGTTERKGVVRSVSSFLYHRFMQRFSDHDSRKGSTDFRLLDERVCSAMKGIHERQRLFRGLVDWLGFRRVYVEFDAPARFDGAASYTLSKLWELALHTLVSHSEVPLRFVLYLGCFTVTLSTLGITWMQFAEFVIDARWRYTPLAKAMVFNTGLVGVVQMSLGIVGLYVAKIHGEVIGRPLYVVRDVYDQAHPPRKHGRPRPSARPRAVAPQPEDSENVPQS